MGLQKVIIFIEILPSTVGYVFTETLPLSTGMQPRLLTWHCPNEIIHYRDYLFWFYKYVNSKTCLVYGKYNER